MNTKIPSLRRHPSGIYMTQWGGRSRYFGRDRNEAVKLYRESLQNWQAWRQQRDRAMAAPPPTRLLLPDLVQRFLDAKRLQNGPSLETYYTRHLRRFLNIFLGAWADEIRVRDLQDLKQYMLEHGFAHKTINHDIVAVRAMFNWAIELEILPPISLKGCRVIPLGPPPDKSLPQPVVCKRIASADPRVRPWLAVNYLTLARPSEVVRIVQGQGHWSEAGVYRLDEHKNSRRTKQPRHLVFSDLALEQLAKCEPRWSRLDSYSAAVSRLSDFDGPHRLRHSGATHLVRQGVARADVDLVRGQLPSRVSVTYAPIDWQLLRDVVARLTLTPDAVSSSASLFHRSQLRVVNMP